MKKTITLLLALTMVFALAACGSTPAAPAATEAPAADAAQAPAEKIEYTYCVHSSNGSLDEATDLFAKTLEELSGGRIVGKGFTPGTMGSEAELVDAVLMGDMTISWPADTLTLQATGVDDWVSLPGLVKDYDDAKAAYGEGGWISEKLTEQFGANGIVRLAYADNGFRSIATKTPLDTAASLKGLKMRTASVWGMKTFNEGLGAIPTAVDSSEALTALEQGTVDAMENSLINLYNQGFCGPLKYVLDVGALYSGRSLICNADWYNALSAEDQELVKQAAAAASEFCVKTDAEVLEKVMSDTGWTIVEPSAEVQELIDQSIANTWEAAKGVMDNDLLAELQSKIA